MITANNIYLYQIFSLHIHMRKIHAYGLLMWNSGEATFSCRTLHLINSILLMIHDQCYNILCLIVISMTDIPSELSSMNLTLSPSGQDTYSCWNGCCNGFSSSFFSSWSFFSSSSSGCKALEKVFLHLPIFLLYYL